MFKGRYKHLEALIIAQTTLLGSLVEEMHKKGLVDEKSVMKQYEKNLKLAHQELRKYT
jgi:hypothetical protein